MIRYATGVANEKRMMGGMAIVGLLRLVEKELRGALTEWLGIV